jgi:hypothetical protein
MFGKHAGVVEGQLLARGGVQDAAAPLNLLGDLRRAARVRALEQHMLQKVGDSVLVRQLVARASANPEAHSKRLYRRNRLDDDAYAVAQSGLMQFH